MTSHGERPGGATPPVYKVRNFSPDDQAGILELHFTVFGRPMLERHWRWQFLENPFSRPIVYVAESDEGRIVGHYALVPLPLRLRGRNCRMVSTFATKSSGSPPYARATVIARKTGFSAG